MNSVKWVILCFVLLWSSTAFSQSIDDIRKQKEKAEKEIVYLNKLLKDAAKDKSASTEKVNILQEKIIQGERVLHSLSQELDYLRNGISRNENRIALRQLWHQRARCQKKHHRCRGSPAHRNAGSGFLPGVYQ